MSNIDKEGIIIIAISLVITIAIILCIKCFKCFKCDKKNDFSIISKKINQEKVQLL